MLIFDSDNNYSQNLILDFGEEQIKVSSLLISSVFDSIVEINLILDDVIEIEKMDRLSKIKHEYVKIYPDFSNNSAYFLAKPNSTISFNIDTKNYKIYCDKNLKLVNLKGTFENFNQSYEEYTKFDSITDEENKVIDFYEKRQFEPAWFNDQNIFVQNEYKRIVKLTQKKQTVKDENQIFNPSVLKTSTGSTMPFEDLNNCIGLESVKKEVDKLSAVLQYKMQSGAAMNESKHMCFYGNPGTGKTTIARIMAGIFYQLGYIPQNKCVEVNGLELKGANVGQTNIITKSTIDYAKGGVLFIDEAYTLFDNSKDNFGKEVINLLLKEMEDNRDNLIVILAGYYGPMQKLLDSNVGFRSRVKYYFNFEDYSASELFEIFMLSLRNKHLYIERDAMKRVLITLKNARTKRGFGNGRFVENFLNKVEEEHILNASDDKIDTITINDIVSLIDFDEQ